MKKRNRKILLVITMTMLLIFALSGCGSPPKGVSFDGKTITATLETNATTGYLWQWEIADNSIVKHQADSYESYDKDDDVLGVGGVQTFLFEGVSKGKTYITLTNKQNWKNGETAETIVMKVKVNKDGTIDYVKQK